MEFMLINIVDHLYGEKAKIKRLETKVIDKFKNKMYIKYTHKKRNHFIASKLFKNITA